MAIGIRENEFWYMTMRQFNAHKEAHKMRQKMRDEEMWYMGMYIKSAVYVSVEQALAGRKSKAKYMEKPILQMIEEENYEMTEEEINREIQKAILNEERWSKQLKAKGLPETKL